MLVAAAFWRPEGPSSSISEVSCQPQLAHYVAGWPRASDLGVIALDGLASLSLSVESENYARRLYGRVGSRQVGEVNGSLTMLLRLARPA